MAFDGFFLTAVLSELEGRLMGARVEKIHQPSRDTVILHLRCEGGCADPSDEAHSHCRRNGRGKHRCRSHPEGGESIIPFREDKRGADGAGREDRCGCALLYSGRNGTGRRNRRETDRTSTDGKVPGIDCKTGD